LNFDIIEYRFKMKVSGSGKGQKGWFKLERVSVSYDHPSDAGWIILWTSISSTTRKVLLHVLRLSSPQSPQGNS